jgi:hypothetical protein
VSAITTLDQYIAAVKYPVTFNKTGARTTVAAIPYSSFDLAGNPGVGTLNVGNTANGIVPTDATAGYPVIPAFAGSWGGISKIEFGSTVACRIALFDRVFAAGAYPYNADVTLASQPSFAGRIPGAIYSGLELWVEAVTAFTLVPAIQINYLDQDGNAGDTGSVACDLALPVGRCQRIPLAAGDNGIYGVSGIVRVRCITASAGTFNVMVLRRLASMRVRSVNDGDIRDFLKTGLPQIYADSALYQLVSTDSTAMGVPEMSIEIVTQ